MRARVQKPLPGVEFVVHQSSPFLPRLFSPRWLSDFAFKKRLEIARKILIRKGCKKIVLYLWRPEFEPALDFIPSDLSCYHIDDEYSFSAQDSPISEDETKLISRVDQVFIHSPGLLEKKGNINPHTAFTPNGVDFKAYASEVPEPEDIRGIPHPRIGYSGRIKRQLDWQLLRELVTHHPEWNFVFVGASNGHEDILGLIQDLSQRSNVRFLGDKTTSELAQYPQHFDVCVMPYIQDGYTKYIYPLKLHEYLASGRPVVGTPIPSLNPFRDSILLPNDVEQWAAAIAESLLPAANTSYKRMMRQEIAQKFDWEVITRHIAEEISSRLGPEIRLQLDEGVRLSD